MGGKLREVIKVTQSIAIAGKRYPYVAKIPNRCVAHSLQDVADMFSI